MKIRIKAGIKLTLGMLLMIIGISISTSIKIDYPLWSLITATLSTFVIGMGSLFIFTKTAFEEMKKEQEEVK